MSKEKVVTLKAYWIPLMENKEPVTAVEKFATKVNGEEVVLGTSEPFPAYSCVLIMDEAPEDLEPFVVGIRRWGEFKPNPESFQRFIDYLKEVDEDTPIEFDLEPRLLVEETLEEVLESLLVLVKYLNNRSDDNNE